MSVKQLTLGGAQLSVTPLCDVYAGLDVETSRPRAVQVTGIASDTSREFLTLLFENQRKSGGGEIDELEYDNSTGTAIVTFTDPESKYGDCMKVWTVFCDFVYVYRLAL